MSTMRLQSAKITVSLIRDMPCTYRQRKLLVMLSSDGRYFDEPMTLAYAGKCIRILVNIRRSKYNGNQSRNQG